MTQEEINKSEQDALHKKILYDYFLAYNKKSREEAIKLIEGREFHKLAKEYHLIHWYDVKEKEIRLKSSLATDVIAELKKLSEKIAPNESDIYVYGNIDENENEAYLTAGTKIYTIVEFSKCEKIANSYASSAMWKIKYQPSGKDTKRYLKIINDYNKK